MRTSRRGFIKAMAAAAVAAIPAEGSSRCQPGEESVGVLVDVPKCIGCRLCEHACQKAHGFDPPPVETFQDKSVFERLRIPEPRAYTTVNCYPNESNPAKPHYVKINCLHCVDPSCVSACLVGALQKKPTGPVLYDAGKCMGCRYCMVACPFEMPAYEYKNPLTPQVRKCDLCAEFIPERQAVPACVAACPAEVLTYGRRADLLQIAHERIARHPETYLDHVYGESEGGGTSWLYLSSVNFASIGFHFFQPEAPPRLTEAIQHGVFKKFGPPLMLYGLLGSMMWLSREHKESSAESTQTASSAGTTIGDGGR